MEKVSVICSDSDEPQNLSNTFRCVMRKGNCFEFVHSFVHFYQNEMNIINPKKRILLIQICLNETSPSMKIVSSLEKQLLMYLFSKKNFFLNRFKDKSYKGNIKYRLILKIHHSSVHFACSKV